MPDEPFTVRLVIPLLACDILDVLILRFPNESKYICAVLFVAHPSVLAAGKYIPFGGVDKLDG